MKVNIDFGIIPIGAGVSLSKYIIACHEILDETGLEVKLHAFGTNIEGEWDEVISAVKRCHEKVHEMGAPRILTTIKLATRTDREQTMSDKVESVLQQKKKGHQSQ